LIKAPIFPALIPEKVALFKPKFEPGGGGVNVSRALKELGGSSSCNFLAGGYSVNFMKHLSGSNK